MLKNSKHEIFAQKVAEGKTYTEAALLAGYSEKAARFQGSKLATNRNIAARIDELKANISQKAVQVLRCLESVGPREAAGECSASDDRATADRSRR